MAENVERQASYPNVAPEPSMYCPNVLMGPLGPAPYRMMLKPPMERLSNATSFQVVTQVQIVPKINPMISPTAGVHYEASVTDSSMQQHQMAIIQPPSIAPIFPLLNRQLSWPISRRYALSHLHLSKVEGPCIRPPPVELDGIGGILERAMRSHRNSRQARG